MPGPMFNPGMGNRCGMMKSPEQIQQEMNQLMQQYNNMYQNMSNRMPMNEPAQIVNARNYKLRACLPEAHHFWPYSR